MSSISPIALAQQIVERTVNTNNHEIPKHLLNTQNFLGCATAFLDSGSPLNRGSLCLLIERITNIDVLKIFFGATPPSLKNPQFYEQIVAAHRNIPDSSSLPLTIILNEAINNHPKSLPDYNKDPRNQTTHPIHQLFLRMRHLIPQEFDKDVVAFHVDKVDGKCLTHLVHFFIRNSGGVINLVFVTKESTKADKKNLAVKTICNLYDKFFTILHGSDRVILLTNLSKERISDILLAKKLFQRPIINNENRDLATELRATESFKECAITFITTFKPLDKGVFTILLDKAKDIKVLKIFYEKTVKHQQFRGLEIFLQYISKDPINWEIAKRAFIDAQTFFPNYYSKIYSYFIWYAWHEKHIKDADNAYEKACKEGFADSEIHLTYIECLLSKGDDDMAKKIYQEHVAKNIGKAWEKLSIDAKTTCAKLADTIQLTKFLFQNNVIDDENKDFAKKLKNTNSFRECIVTFISSSEPLNIAVFAALLEKVEDKELLNLFFQQSIMHKQFRSLEICLEYIGKADIIWPVAKNTFSQALTLYPLNSQLYSQFIRCAGNANHFKEAEQEYNKACKEGFADSEIHLAYLELLLKSNKYDLAKNIFSKLIKSSPDSTELYVGYIRNAGKIGKFEEAETVYGEACNKKVANCEIHLTYIECLLSQGDNPTANKIYQEHAAKKVEKVWGTLSIDAKTTCAKLTNKLQLTKLLFKHNVIDGENKDFSMKLRKTKSFGECIVTFISSAEHLNKGVFAALLEKVEDEELLNVFFLQAMKSEQFQTLGIYLRCIGKAEINWSVAKQAFLKAQKFSPTYFSRIYSDFIWYAGRASQFEAAKSAYKKTCEENFADPEIHLAYIELLLNNDEKAQAKQIFFENVYNDDDDKFDRIFDDLSNRAKKTVKKCIDL